MEEVWYRYFDYGANVESPPFLEELPVLRHTERCVYLKFFDEEKRVLKNARKRFAYPTKELALDSYIIRKRRQAGWAQATVNHANFMLKQAEAIQRGETLPKSDKFQFDLS